MKYTKCGYPFGEVLQKQHDGFNWHFNREYQIDDEFYAAYERHTGTELEFLLHEDFGIPRQRPVCAPDRHAQLTGYQPNECPQEILTITSTVEIDQIIINAFLLKQNFTMVVQSKGNAIESISIRGAAAKPKALQPPHQRALLAPTTVEVSEDGIYWFTVNVEEVKV